MAKVERDPAIFKDNLSTEKNLDVEGDASIGKDTASKVGFFGVTPVDQPATVTAVDTANAANNKAAINAVILRLQELGLIA
jgi:hypothetical protein